MNVTGDKLAEVLEEICKFVLEKNPSECIEKGGTFLLLKKLIKGKVNEVNSEDVPVEQGNLGEELCKMRVRLISSIIVEYLWLCF